MFLIATGSGYWARGANIQDAARAVRDDGAESEDGAFCVFFPDDDTPEVSQSGYLRYEGARYDIGSGTVGMWLKVAPPIVVISKEK